MIFSYVHVSNVHKKQCDQKLLESATAQKHQHSKENKTVNMIAWHDDESRQANRSIVLLEVRHTKNRAHIDN